MDQTTNNTTKSRKTKTDKALLTLVERKTRQVKTIPIAIKSANAVTEAIQLLKELYGNKFNEVFKSITSDNGSEFADLINLEASQKPTMVYFAHPYSSFERGSNERHNGLIRRFIKKGKAIKDYDVNYISQVDEWCNTLPRKILNYNTPEQLF